MIKIKILLIKPPITLPTHFKGIGRFFPPIGLGYIAAILRNNGYEVKIVDTSIEDWKRINKRWDGMEYMGMSFDSIKELIAKENPDILGITSVTMDAVNALEIAKIAKEINEKIFVVIGGPHACAVPDKVIENQYIDAIVLGEGEYTMLDLVKKLEKNKSLLTVQGLWFKENGNTFKSECSEQIQELNLLPFPARDLMNYEKYFEASKYLQGSRRVEARRDTIISSRGCPYGCVFCSVRISMGRNFRPRSPENVVAEIEEIVNKYNVGDIGFEDDNFTFDMDRAHKICDLMIEKGLNKKVSWSTPNGVRADKVYEELLIKMQKAGCEEVIFAPESGNQYVVDNIINKQLDLKKVEENAKICQKLGLRCGMFFVIGVPGETKEQINDTIEYAKRMKKEYGVIPMVFTAQPYYNTDLYRMCKEKGYLTHTDEQSFEQGLINEEAMISTPEFTPEYLLEIRKDFAKYTDERGIWEMITERPVDSIRAFILHPKYIIKHVFRLVLSKNYAG